MVDLNQCREMMSGWARSRTGKVWHQVCDVTGGSPGGERVRLLCSGQVVTIGDANPIYDYRCSPSPRCRQPFCQTEVAP